MKHIIILPVRNGMPYLATAVESVLAQTYSDWRLVVLENYSTDDTIDVLSKYTDDRIIVFHADRPLSIVENWRRGLGVLEDDKYLEHFVTFIGHDDYFYPEFLSSVNDLIAKAPDATLYQVLFDLIDSDGMQIRPCRPVPCTETAEDFIQARGWGLRDSFGTGYVFRRADYIRVGGIPCLPSLLFADDLLFARLSALGYKACLQVAECAYRLHAGSASGSMTPAKLNAHIEALASYISAVQQEFTKAAGSLPVRYALSRLLARESMLYGSRITQWALTPSNRVRAAELGATFASLCRDTRCRDRGPAQGPRMLLRRLRLACQLALARLSESAALRRAIRGTIARRPQ